MKTFKEYVNESKVEIYEYNSLSYEEKLADYNGAQSKSIMSAIKKANKKIESPMLQELIDMAKKDIPRSIVFDINGKVLCLSYSPKTTRFAQFYNEFMASQKPEGHITMAYGAKDIIKLLNSL